MQDLEGRLAFVTGSGNGIGRGMARAFARAGMKIAVVDIDPVSAERTTEELKKETDAATFVFDVSDRAAMADAADAAEKEFGPAAIVCNNAAMSIQLPPAEMTYRAWDLSLNVTLGGVVNGIQTFLPRMLERNIPAHIVNTASQAGLVAFHGGRQYMYNMAKFAIVGLSEALDKILEGTNVGITLLCPGYTNTGGTERGLRDLAKKGLPPDVEAAERERMMGLADRMANFGQPADELGQQVLEAVQADRFYLHGANRVADVEQRMRAIIESMPPLSERDRALAAYLDH
jgi:NAD(P)-dependent dehydrogenase (short-subunit alcohol dehydrogenase family)